MTDWSYDAWPSVEPTDWSPAARGDHPDDSLDFHVDLGCGKLKKARIGVDRFPAAGVDHICNLEAGVLPFETSSVRSIVTHHMLEHLGLGFIPLMDECYRVLMPGAPMRVIVPLFPSRSAMEDPDHKRMFLEGTFDAFAGDPENYWMDSFAVPYTRARFQVTDKLCSPLLPPDLRWGPDDARELRTTLRAAK